MSRYCQYWTFGSAAMPWSMDMACPAGYGRYVPSHICPRRYVLNLLLRFYVILHISFRINLLIY